MKQRTIDLIVASARVLSSRPDAISVTESAGTYTIDAANCDLGAIMGQGRRHAAAVEHLARLIDPNASVHVVSRNQVKEQHDKAEWRRNAPAASWSREDEASLKAAIESVVRLIYPSVTLRFIPALKESIYTVGADYVSMDTVGSLHTIFRAWGKRHGRYVTINPIDERPKA